MKQYFFVDHHDSSDSGLHANRCQPYNAPITYPMEEPLDLPESQLDLMAFPGTIIYSEPSW